MSFYKIDPTYLSNYVNFNYENQFWKYTPEQDISMPKVQAEGAAKAWNFLLDYKIALLADEVGMGKTIQALAIIATLWRQKPNAKVLLYAPNENVAKKWINEYHNFIRYHYIVNDNKVKSSITQEPLRIALYCENHIDLMQKVNLKWPSLFICKTSSLSGLVSPKINQTIIDDIGIKIIRNKEKNEEEKRDWMLNFSKKCNEHFYKIISNNNESPFDLLIFDEAHYLRRSESDESNRSIVAHSFFSGRDISDINAFDTFSPIADKVLLMTATPNHSSSKDINNIVSLFNPNFKNKSPEEILKTICIRRFRRLNGKTKHEYRDEIPNPVKLESLQEKLFFALYQKCLVKFYADKNTSSNNNTTYRILFGYLEGFEFLPRKKRESGIDNPDSNEKESKGDFEKKEDRDIIIELSKKYKKIYKRYPKHPKYDKIISELKPSNDNINFESQKKLIFVRRIPSVFEISSRIITEYDKCFRDVLKDTLPSSISDENLRSYFWNLSQKNKDEDLGMEENDENKNDESEEIQQGIPSSKILELFTIKKEGKFRNTDCSNFRVRFQRKEQIFSLFFEPAMDYKYDEYLLNIVYEKDNKRIYKNSAQYERLKKIKNSEGLLLETEYDINEKPTIKISRDIKSFKTLLGIWYNKKYEARVIQNLVDKAKLEYDKFTVLEKEGFSSYLEKGVLFSSPFIVHFYSYYRQIQIGTSKRGDDLYNEFCIIIDNNIERIGLAEMIAKTITTFNIFYRKELGLIPEKLIKEQWTFLNHTIPVYPYCGDTKRQSITRAFNTPFFPNALIATSVLQEGVDLHYHCSEVIHYGIAWTQGDNEQRVGRVDRMFGKLENALKVNPKTTLPIHYPYLEKTIDQDQICRFILRKYESEKLIDQFKNIDNNNEINYLERIDEDTWKSCFRKPNHFEKIEEPFGVDLKNDFRSFKSPQFINEQSNDLKNLIHPLLNTLKKIFKKEFTTYLNGNLLEENNILCAIKHVRKNGRHQPVLFELLYFEPGLSYVSQPIYCLKIKTPITRKGERYDDLRIFGSLKEFYYSNPTLKICFNDKIKGQFKQYICIDIPLMQINNKNNISIRELLYNTYSLIKFSDELEQKFHKGDIKNEEIIKDGSQWYDNNIYLEKDRIPKLIPNGWKNSSNGIFILKEKLIESENIIMTYKYNHLNSFIRKVFIKSFCYKQLGLYKNDALPVEIELLEKIFKEKNN